MTTPKKANRKRRRAGRPFGLNRKAIQDSSHDDRHTFSVYGEHCMEAPEDLFSLALSLRRCFPSPSDGLDKYLDSLLSKPLASFTKTQAPPPVAAIAGKLLREFVAAVWSGDTRRLCTLADCIAEVHRAEVRCEQQDPMWNALRVIWFETGRKMEGDRRHIPATRSDILRVIRRRHADQGLERCADKRLRQAMKQHGYTARKGKRGGRREGAGRKSIKRASV